MSDFLAHYGVQGQKWGVRRYQYQDGSLTPDGRRHYGYDLKKSKTITLPSDIVYHRITSNKSSGTQEGMYVSYQPNDVEVFRGIFGMGNVQKMALQNRNEEKYKLGNADGEVYELTFKTKEPVKIPSKEARINTFKEFISDKSNRNDVQNEIKDQGKNKKVNLNKLTSDKDYDKAYLYFNECLARGIENDPVNKRYYEFMRNKGYSAIIDENDVRLSSTLRANAPLIIIDPSVIKTDMKVKNLTANDIVPASKKHRLNQSIKVLMNQNREILEPIKQDNKVDKQLSKFSKDYTLKDLSKDRYVNNMSFKKIEKLNELMIKENISRQEAASKLGYNIVL